MTSSEELRARLDDGDIYLGREQTCTVPVRILEGVLLELQALEQDVAESSRVPMPWNTPPVDQAQVQRFMDDVWNKKR